MRKPRAMKFPHGDAMAVWSGNRVVAYAKLLGGTAAEARRLASWLIAFATWSEQKKGKSK